jgi:uncharacterized membrane protein
VSSKMSQMNAATVMGRRFKRSEADDYSTRTSAAIDSNVNAIIRLEKLALDKRTRAERLADRITAFAGSSASLILHAVVFGAWIIINTGNMPGVKPFDRLPFTLLTFMVSLEAIFLALLVLMAQNRIMREANLRAHLDLQINMLAEQESTLTLRTLRRICDHLGLDHECDQDAAGLEESTSVHRLAKALEEHLPD